MGMSTPLSFRSQSLACGRTTNKLGSVLARIKFKARTDAVGDLCDDHLCAKLAAGRPLRRRRRRAPRQTAPPCRRRADRGLELSAPPATTGFARRVMEAMGLGICINLFQAS